MTAFRRKGLSIVEGYSLEEFENPGLGTIAGLHAFDNGVMSPL